MCKYKLAGLGKCPAFTVPHHIMSFLYSWYHIIDPEIRNWLIFILWYLGFYLWYCNSWTDFIKIPKWGDDWRLPYTVTLCLCECRDIFFFAKSLHLFIKACFCRAVATKSNHLFQTCLKILYGLVAYVCIFAYAYTHMYIHILSLDWGRKKKGNDIFCSLLLMTIIISNSFLNWNWLANDSNIDI